ncbi:hypothetical protein ACJZ2D_014962 [Fusarium nematophilum]
MDRIHKPLDPPGSAKASANQTGLRDAPCAATSGQEAADKYGQSSLNLNHKAESKLRWKLDLYLLPLFFASLTEQTSVRGIVKASQRGSPDLSAGNARLAGLEQDLNMTGYDYNISLSVFYISYILFELPLNVVCKWIGPGWFIPASCLGFGICTICTAFVNDFSSLCGIRFLLGIFEAAMLPANVYYLSRWYRRSELTFRLSFVIISASLAGAFGGLLASAILKIHHFGTVYSWKMIFLIEETARWLSDQEKDLAAARIRSERIATTEVVDKFNKKKFMLGIFNPVVLMTSMIFLLNNITVHGLSFFLPTIVRTIYPERTVEDQQLLTVPPYALGTFMCVLVCYLSWRLDKRGIFLIIFAPFSIIGYSMFLASADPHVRYAATFLPVCGIFSFGALTNSHVSANVVSDTARSSGVAVNVMFGNLGGLISTWAFLQSDAPLYRIGNGLNLAAQSTIFLIAVAMFFWILSSNKGRARRDVEAELSGMTLLEIQDLDWQHPGFRWHN